MKGVILAGGLGTRLYPLTYATNKHLLPIFDRPMIFYPIQTMVRAGITDILIVTSGPHSGHFISVLRNGTKLGVSHLEYAYQEKPNGGIADALSLARQFADNGPITVMLGDNTTDADISGAVSKFYGGATIFIKRVPDPKRFGVPRFDTDGKTVLEILEKPETPPSDYAVTGLYIYDHRVFDFISECTPSARGELEITDVNNLYIKRGLMSCSILDGYWRDAGTFTALLDAGNHWEQKTHEKTI